MSSPAISISGALPKRRPALTGGGRRDYNPDLDMGDTGDTGGARVDARGIRPPDAYAIEERPAPDGAVVLALRGEVDLAAAPALRLRFEEALARRPAAVVVDMAELTFADSAALRELLRADAAMRAEGTRFSVAALPPAVERLLELTRADELLDAAPTVEAALRQPGAPR
jgi:anti-sigma B factor antagonist